MISRIALLFLVFAVPHLVQAQPASRLQQQAGIVGGIQQFAPEAGALDPAFDFDGPMIGARISSAGLNVLFARGEETSVRNGIEGSTRLTDFRLNLGSALYERPLSRTVAFVVPLGIESSFKKVTREEESTTFDVFDYTGLSGGIGPGLRVDDRRVAFRARAMPTIGFATRSFGSSFGRITGIALDAELWTRPVVGRFGLSIAWEYRWQNWRVGGLDAFDLAGQGKVDHKARGHVFAVGLSW